MMTPQDYTALAGAVAERDLGNLGVTLGFGMARYLPPHGVTTPLRLAHFIAQCAHETERFEFLEELGGPAYCAQYDGRRDLGNTEAGDGYRFKGRGLLQITGRYNYSLYGKALGADLVADPQLAARPDIAVATAAIFWDGHGLNPLADKDDLLDITRRINGGLNGLDDRHALLERAKAQLKVPA
jgi:putative chitinase